MVAGTVSSLPSEGWKRRVRGAVFVRVQVTRQPHATNDQLPGLPDLNRISVRIDDREIPPRQRQSNGYCLTRL